MEVARELLAAKAAAPSPATGPGALGTAVGPFAPSATPLGKGPKEAAPEPPAPKVDSTAPPASAASAAFPAAGKGPGAALGLGIGPVTVAAVEAATLGKLPIHTGIETVPEPKTLEPAAPIMRIPSPTLPVEKPAAALGLGSLPPGGVPGGVSGGVPGGVSGGVSGGIPGGVSEGKAGGSEAQGKGSGELLLASEGAGEGSARQGSVKEGSVKEGSSAKGKAAEGKEIPVSQHEVSYVVCCHKLFQA